MNSLSIGLFRRRLGFTALHDESCRYTKEKKEVKIKGGGETKSKRASGGVYL